MSNVGYVTAWAKTDLQPLIEEEVNTNIADKKDTYYKNTVWFFFIKILIIFN